MLNCIRSLLDVLKSRRHFEQGMTEELQFTSSSTPTTLCAPACHRKKRRGGLGSSSAA